jgi:hypothetical protein
VQVQSSVAFLTLIHDFVHSGSRGLRYMNLSINDISKLFLEIIYAVTNCEN